MHSLVALLPPHKSQNHHPAQTKQLQEKPAHLAERPNQLYTQGNPQTVGLVKPSRKLMFPNTALPGGRRPLGCPLPGGCRHGPAVSCPPPRPVSGQNGRASGKANINTTWPQTALGRSTDRHKKETRLHKSRASSHGSPEVQDKTESPLVTKGPGKSLG